MNGTIPATYTALDCERSYAEPTKGRHVKRSAFEIDKGRIIHSAAFRRLQGKTQVLGVGERDFYRTRLTHSLEVAQLGRGLCQETDHPPDFRVDPDLIETICLAHDIGHPPFGHRGESALHKEMLEHGGFGANPQNLRIVTFIETKLDDGGLNLTRATLDGLTKYPVLFSEPAFTADDKPKFVYRSDEHLLGWIKRDVKDSGLKPIEAEIADWADTIAYSVDDIEDNFRAGLFDFVEMRKRAAEISEVLKDSEHKPTFSEEQIAGLAEELQNRLVMQPSTLRKRKAALKSWSSQMLGELMNGCKIKTTEATSKETLLRYKYRFIVPEGNKRNAKLLKAAALVLVFQNPRVTTLEHKGRNIVLSLFRTFVEDPALLPRDFFELITVQPENKRRLVADFVSGMTDNYAMDYYARLELPREGSFYEHV